MQQDGKDYLRELREDHARFSRVLSMIGRDARRLVDEPDTVLPLFAEAVDYVVSFQNVYHHPREEVMFARIAEKSETLAAAASSLSREHHATARVGEDLLSLLGNGSHAQSDRPNREQLARSLEKFARSMRGHIAQEEEILYSQAWAELTPQDWDALAGSAAAADPLDGSDGGRYPLLARYVAEGQTRSNVDMDGGALGQIVESGLKRASALVDQVGSINRTLKRQSTEACELSLKSIRAMPVIPILQPQTSFEVSTKSAQEFGRAYVRWLREWSEIYRSPDAR
ncbi:MAG: hemerythrin domain-containing protein [Gammaproteobacteria bacterium]|nr:hemerythrin domain-containing protein [Gammaproteobacteria bacterium]